MKNAEGLKPNISAKNFTFVSEKEIGGVPADAGNSVEVKDFHFKRLLH